MADAELRVIEEVYGVQIENRGDVARWIAGVTQDRITILTYTTALNTYVAIEGRRGSLTIPQAILDEIRARIIRKREHI